MYRPRVIPTNFDAAWFQQELQNIASATESAVNGVVLNKLYAAPSRIYEGLTVLAWTPWNPGAGDGVYTYYNSTWNKLG